MPWKILTDYASETNKFNNPVGKEIASLYSTVDEKFPLGDLDTKLQELYTLHGKEKCLQVDPQFDSFSVSSIHMTFFRSVI